MAFKLIPKGQMRLSATKPPRVSISFPGRLNFSTGAVAILNKEYVYEYVLLYWDEEISTIAIRPSRKKDERAFKILYNKTGRNVSVQAKSFFQHIGYDSRRTRSFPLIWNESEGAFDIDLSDAPKEQLKTVPIVRRNVAAPNPTMSALDLVDWYTRSEVCDRLRISKRTLDRILNEGGIEKRRRPCRGKRAEIVFSPRDVDASRLSGRGRTA